MSVEEMIALIAARNFTAELVDALIDYEWESNTYDVLNEYGAIDDDGVRDRMAEDVRCALAKDPQGIIDYIKEE